MAATSFAQLAQLMSARDLIAAHKADPNNITIPNQYLVAAMSATPSGAAAIRVNMIGYRNQINTLLGTASVLNINGSPERFIFRDQLELLGLDMTAVNAISLNASIADIGDIITCLYAWHVLELYVEQQRSAIDGNPVNTEHITYTNLYRRLYDLLGRGGGGGRSVATYTSKQAEAFRKQADDDRKLMQIKFNLYNSTNNTFAPQNQLTVIKAQLDLETFLKTHFTDYVNYYMGVASAVKTPLGRSAMPEAVFTNRIIRRAVKSILMEAQEDGVYTYHKALDKLGGKLTGCPRSTADYIPITVNYEPLLGRVFINNGNIYVLKGIDTVGILQNGINPSPVQVYLGTSKKDRRSKKLKMNDRNQVAGIADEWGCINNVDVALCAVLAMLTPHAKKRLNAVKKGNRQLRIGRRIVEEAYEKQRLNLSKQNVLMGKSVDEVEGVRKSSKGRRKRTCVCP